jgi:predicted DCC family thiol-disulfide oxidoreductase YuxK
MKKYSYIIFDGECGFCNKIIMFIARNDKNNTFKFISNFSKFGAKILLKNKIKGLEKSTIILVENENEIYTKSLAVRKILLKIKYYKMVGYLMFLFPKKISDYVYDLISKNRKLIIKNNICEIPNTVIQKKFIM